MLILRIDFENNCAEFVISLECYDENSVFEVGNEFSDICNTVILPKDGLDGKSLYVRLELKDSEYNIKEITYSFLNFLLGLTHRFKRNSIL